MWIIVGDVAEYREVFGYYCNLLEGPINTEALPLGCKYKEFRAI